MKKLNSFTSFFQDLPVLTNKVKLSRSLRLILALVFGFIIVLSSGLTFPERSKVQAASSLRPQSEVITQSTRLDHTDSPTLTIRDNGLVIDQLLTNVDNDQVASSTLVISFPSPLNTIDVGLQGDFEPQTPITLYTNEDARYPGYNEDSVVKLKPNNSQNYEVSQEILLRSDLNCALVIFTIENRSATPLLGGRLMWLLDLDAGRDPISDTAEYDPTQQIIYHTEYTTNNPKLGYSVGFKVEEGELLSYGISTEIDNDYPDPNDDNKLQATLAKDIPTFSISILNSAENLVSWQVVKIPDLSRGQAGRVVFSLCVESLAGPPNAEAQAKQKMFNNFNSIGPIHSGGDVTISKYSSANTVIPGQPLTFTLVYTNLGPGTVTGVQITDDIPEDKLTQIDYTFAGPVITQVGNIEYDWQVADLAPGEGGVITVTGTVKPALPPSTINNEVNISANNGILSNDNTGNNTASVTVPIELLMVSFISGTYSVDEGSGSATVGLKLNQPPPIAVTVGYSTTNGTATASEDYTGIKGSVTFSPGEAEKTFTIDITQDPFDEEDETITLTITHPIHGVLPIPPSTAILTITDDDPQPSLFIEDAVDVLEGNDAEQSHAFFPLQLTQKSGKPIIVQYKTIDDSAKGSDNDFISKTGTITIAPGMKTQTIPIIIVGDNKDEDDEECFSIELISITNATIGHRLADGKILDDDALPIISISEATSVTEGREGETRQAQFTVTLAPVSGREVRAFYTTADGKAEAGKDYIPKSGQLIFNPELNETTKQISIDVKGDNDIEGVESFFVEITNVINATPNITKAEGKIVENVIYLPLVMKNSVMAPDLIVDIKPDHVDNNLEVIIRNIGNTPVIDGFWVDVYINPTAIPQVNQSWGEVSTHGLAWGVNTDIPVNGTLTLRIGDKYYFPNFPISNPPNSLPIGTILYAQVDSLANDQTTYFGKVLENHEIIGAPYNNLKTKTINSTSLDLIVPLSVNNKMQSSLYNDLPPRD